MDIIALRGIAASGHHGVFEAEKRLAQPFIVDLDLSLDLSRASDSDELSDTVDYAEITQRVIADIRGDSCNLIEKLAGRIAEHCLEYSRVQEVIVTVHKPEASMPGPVSDVAVTLRRARA